MKIVKLINECGKLNIETDLGKKVCIYEYDADVQKFEKLNGVKIHDMIREFCKEVEPLSLNIFKYIESIREEFNTNFSFSEGIYLDNGIIKFTCFINTKEYYSCNINLLFNQEYMTINPSIEFESGSRGDTFGCNLFQHFNYDDLNKLYQFINGYLQDDTGNQIKSILSNLNDKITYYYS